jgi:hypothetical protein
MNKNSNSNFNYFINSINSRIIYPKPYLLATTNNSKSKNFNSINSIVELFYLFIKSTTITIIAISHFSPYKVFKENSFYGDSHFKHLPSKNAQTIQMTLQPSFYFFLHFPLIPFTIIITIINYPTLQNSENFLKLYLAKYLLCF